jgi:hypothetical protein
MGDKGPTGPAGNKGPDGPVGPPGSAGVDCNKEQFHPYSYSRKFSAIGQTITVADRNYKVIRVPFYEFGTGDHYAVTYPDDGFVSISTSHAIDDYTQKCGIVLNGVKAAFKVRDIIDYSGSGNFTVNGHLWVSMSAQIGETNLYIAYFRSSGYQSTAIKTNDGDYVDEILWGDIQHPDKDIEFLQELMNYVWIEKL